MADSWRVMLQSAKKTCLLQDGKHKVHYTFTDGTEMVEEYDLRNYDLIVRKLKKPSSVGISRPAKWEFEVGQDLLSRNMLESDGIVENINSPMFVRVDSRTAFEWRIRNLPYSIETYQVSIDNESRSIVVRTTNKKYFKKFNVVDMDRFHLPLDSSRLHIAHANNTLIIKYDKPAEILDVERRTRDELDKLKQSEGGGDVQTCNPS